MYQALSCFTVLQAMEAGRGAGKEASEEPQYLIKLAIYDTTPPENLASVVVTTL